VNKRICDRTSDTLPLPQALRRLGLMDGNPTMREQDMLQINHEKKLRATLEGMLALAREKVRHAGHVSLFSHCKHCTGPGTSHVACYTSAD
jgi:hypothetical protein